MRQLIGYERLGYEACVAALNAVYEDWNLLQNLFSPNMKLKEKKREGGKYRKTYHPAQTPAERLLAWSGLSQEKRAWIKRMQREQDPFELHQRVELKLRALWKIVRDAQHDEETEPDTATTEGGGGARFVAVDPYPNATPRCDLFVRQYDRKVKSLCDYSKPHPKLGTFAWANFFE